MARVFAETFRRPLVAADTNHSRHQLQPTECYSAKVPMAMYFMITDLCMVLVAENRKHSIGEKIVWHYNVSAFITLH